MEQGLQVAADDLRTLFDDADDGGANALRHLLGAMLIKRRRVDAVRKPLHHERTVEYRGQNVRRHANVVAEEIAFRQLLLRPEYLPQVRHTQTITIR